MEPRIQNSTRQALNISEDLARDFADDSLTHADIAQKYGISWDTVQRKRSKWRKVNGIGPVPYGPRTSVTVSAPQEIPADKADEILRKLDIIIAGLGLEDV